ncbi:MalY/PatB family protein [Serratia sp. L9]|uniref:MalY/PatB family protein n=1 Tax=Serratia sp. L9 TaxID=3423946 RepID=UPI003D679E4C
MFDFDEEINRKNTASAKWMFPNVILPKYVTTAPLPLWVADMDFRSPPCVIDALKSAIDHGIFGYGNVTDSMLEAIVNWQLNEFQWKIKPEWIVQTPGVVTAINFIIQAFTKPGDSIAIQTPVYAPFHSSPKNNGRYITDAPLKLENGRYIFDADIFESRLQKNTRMLILCNPHNPFGKVWSREELTAIGDICLRHNILVIADEIHQDLIFNADIKHIPFASISEDFAKITITCTAPSKTFNVAGLQTSNLIISNPWLRLELQNSLSRSGVPAPNILGQVACEAAYRNGKPWLDELKKYLKDNFLLIKKSFSDNSNISVIDTEALYLAWIDFRGTGLQGDELHQHLLINAGVWLDAGLKFGNNGSGFARINFGCTRATLKEALDRIERSFN